MSKSILSKKQIGYASIFFLLITAFSCSKDKISPAGGQAEFTFSAHSSTGGRIQSDATSLLISVKDSHGTLVYNNKKIALYNFSGKFISEPVDLVTGAYTLTQFIVLDATGQAIYATPLEGSALAGLVKDPLPISFTVTKDNVTEISPEVLVINSIDPTNFGYATFSFNVVKTFNFKVGVFAYDNTSKNFKLTTSSISVAANDTVQFTKNIPDSTSTITVKDNYANYTISVTKSGYTTYIKTFAISDLKTYSTGKVLTINLMASALSNGLVGEYLFNGNTLDTSGKNHNGTNNGAVLTTDRKGISNSAYLFSGVNSTYIMVPDNTDMNFTANHDFSVSVWAVVDPNQVLTGGINDIVRKWNGDAQGYPFCIAYGNSSASIPSQQNKFMSVRYDGSGCGNVVTSWSPVVSSSVFHHIVHTKVGSIQSMYVDNVLVDQQTDITSCVTTNNANITFGSRGSLVRFFTGKIDDVRFYNRGLSAAEVDVLFKE